MDEATSPEPDPDAEKPSLIGRGAVELLTLGLSIAAVLVACGALGYLVDRWLGTGPWFTLVGFALGIAAAVAMTVTTVRRYL